MMKNIAALFLILVFSACQSTENSERQSQLGKPAFDTSDLKGRYKLDFAPSISESTDKEKLDDGARFGMAMLSSIDIEVSFYENNKGAVFIDGAMIDFLRGFSDKSWDQMEEFSYKLENDSMVYMKFKTEEDYELIGAIRKVGPNFDYIKIVTIDSAGNRQSGINMKKLYESK